MTDVDPPRLTDLGIPGLDALDEARRLGPSDEAVARLAAKLGVGGPPAAGSAGPSSAAPVAKVAAVKAPGAVAISAAVAIVAWQLTHRPGVVERPTTAPANVAASAPNPAATNDFKAPEAPAIVAPMTAVPDAQAPPSASAKSRTATELELIGKAERALHSDPTGALRLAKEHARLFPRGLLTQEREVLAIDALSRLGRLDEARTRADVFTRSYPSSPHNQRLRRLLHRATGLDGGP